MIDVSDLVKCRYALEPNLVTTHNCASVVREALSRMGFEEAARDFPVMPDPAFAMLERPPETLPWARLGCEPSSLRVAGDIVVTRDLRSGMPGVGVLLKSNGGRVLTALPGHGVRIVPMRALGHVQSVHRPLR